MKKLLSLFITLALLAGMISVVPAYAEDVDFSEGEWLLYQEEDFSANLWFTPYYEYYGNVNKTYGFAFQGYTGKESEWNNAANDASQFMAMPTGIEGDYVVDFDMFLDDVESSNGTALTPNYKDSFKIRVYGGELSKPDTYNNRITTQLLYQNVFGWNGTLKDDNDVAYPYTKALASSKYVTAPTDGTPSWVDMRISLIGNTLEIYAKWNTASIWRKLKTYTVTAYDGARGLAFSACANVGYDNFKVYQNCEIEESEFATYQIENFSANRWFTPYYEYYGNVNKTYGFAFQGYTGKQGEWNNAGKDANQFMAMPEGIEGDYVVDFDMFLDDVETISGEAAIPNYSGDFKIRVYGGGLTTSGANNKIETSLLYQNVFGWSGTLKDDNDVAYPYTKALASSKYVTAPTDGTPSWIDMRISLIGNTLEIYAKWNTASIWRKLKTYTVTAYDGARGLALVACANVGYDNFKVYQTAEQVVNETFEAGTTTYKDAISLSKTDYTKVASAGYLTLGYNQNVISTVDSYSDYIVEFDYNPYFINTAPRLVFTIGGYSFHMRGISNGISGAEGVTTGATITKKESFSFVTREWHTIRVKKVGSTFRLSAKKATDENYTLIYEGTFAEDKTEPFKMNVYDTSDVQSGHFDDYQAYMDNLKIWDLSDYVVYSPVYDKEYVVNGETVTATASVTKNRETDLVSEPVLVTVLYKADGEQWICEEIKVDEDIFAVGDNTPLKNEVTIPVEGTYKIKSFVWSLGNLYPYCDAVELSME